MFWRHKNSVRLRAFFHLACGLVFVKLPAWQRLSINKPGVGITPVHQYYYAPRAFWGLSNLPPIKRAVRLFLMFFQESFGFAVEEIGVVELDEMAGGGCEDQFVMGHGRDLVGVGLLDFRLHRFVKGGGARAHQ